MNSTSTSTAYTLGCNQGNFDAGYNPPVSSEVVLDFGGQLSNGSGADMIEGETLRTAKLRIYLGAGLRRR
jgi:hypothetical protein